MLANLRKKRRGSSCKVEAPIAQEKLSLPSSANAHTERGEPATYAAIITAFDLILPAPSLGSGWAAGWTLPAQTLELSQVVIGTSDHQSFPSMAESRELRRLRCPAPLMQI
jgi:hypothetical protein